MPGQHSTAPPPTGAKHEAVRAAPQHTSMPMFVQVPGCPPSAPGGLVHRLGVSATHAPVEVLQTWPVAHCESSVHLLQTLFTQSEPTELVAQSVFVQQLPGMHAQPVPVQSAAPAAAQQKSPVFAHGLAVQAPETQRPALEQISPEP